MNEQVKPIVGMAATIGIGSDCYPATVVKVTRCTCTVQEDNAKRTDRNGQSESQSYEYWPNPFGRQTTFRLTKRGWRKGCYRLGLGHRRMYQDPSF